MNILATQYTLSTNSFEIYVAGCNGQPHCKGCHNPESWNFNQGTKFDLNYWNKINIKINEFNDLINNIMIFGGEPLDQNINDLSCLLNCLYDTFDKPIWIFTRYDISNVPQFVKDTCTYIKCGKYIPELTTDNNIQYEIKLATSNQKIYKKGLDY